MNGARRFLAAILCAAFLVSACGSGDGGPSEPSVVRAEGVGGVPADTTVDWVSYAEAVVVATVMSEKAKPLRTDLLTPAGAGSQTRLLTMRVDTRVWSRPGARTVPQEFQMESDGWNIRNFVERRPYALGRLRLEVGSTYLLPLTWVPATEFGPALFGPLGPETPALMGSDNRPVGGEGVTGSALQGFIGKPLDEIAATLQNTSPDPVAAKYFHLDPAPRWNAVLKEMVETQIP